MISSCLDIGPPGKDSENGYGFVIASEAVFPYPTVEITSPYPGTSVHDTITIRAIASDISGNILKVQYRIDSGSWHDDYSSPYQWDWCTWNVNNGQHTITCRAWNMNNYFADDQVTISVYNGGVGGGCIILYVYNGTEYVEEGLLDIHNLDGIDVVTSHYLNTAPKIVNHRLLLRLVEHPKTISHIDRVQLFGRLHNGLLIPIPLISAVHSTLGQVRWKLWFSDDKRVDVLGAGHNEGFSESIDLQFIDDPHHRFTEFIFYIEGNNILIK